jgi:phospholipid/cholesterol/gamma-HCH transport system permease protein
MELLYRLGARTRLLAAAVVGTVTASPRSREVVGRLTVLQIWFTAVQAVGLISIAAFLIGATVAFQTTLVAPAAGGEMLGRIYLTVVGREVAPLLTAMMIIGRSGTAMATELAGMKVSGEIAALRTMGIDGAHYLVAPRVVAGLMGATVLSVYFVVVGLVGAVFVSQLVGSSSFALMRQGFMASLVPLDLPFFLVKTMLLGLLSAWLPCCYGLEAGVSPTEIPQQASRAVITTLVLCVVVNTLVTAGFYALSGAGWH